MRSQLGYTNDNRASQSGIAPLLDLTLADRMWHDEKKLNASPIKPVPVRMTICWSPSEPSRF